MCLPMIQSSHALPSPIPRFPIIAIFHSDAIPGVDYEFMGITLANPTFQFTIAPMATLNFTMTIINDNNTEFYRISIRLELGVFQSGGGVMIRDLEEIYLHDDDGKSSLHCCLGAFCSMYVVFDLNIFNKITYLACQKDCNLETLWRASVNEVF